MIHGRKAGGVVGAVVGGQLHPGQHDRHACRLQALNDLFQIRARVLQVQPAKTIVPAKLQNHDAGLAAEDPGDSTQPARGRLSADPRVDHAIAIAGLIKPLLELKRVGLLGRDSQARREAIAKRHDFGPVVTRRPIAQTGLGGDIRAESLPKAVTRRAGN